MKSPFLGTGIFVYLFLMTAAWLDQLPVEFKLCGDIWSFAHIQMLSK